ncbi:hypothetical protein IscW_ISCW024806 [Ixodes scapularis]|uniref:Uncharacterized protein n=1 Tax=Ixodes scapularis TaxID=6945 RepID=B7QCA0_IXOSC|nr:hypothetical protein IscW_ISCW024806 [Ixodes scapularis]|eukprot:XP_002413164.1 hypothetical protein IscW_ISCW024806 [Ixodes scapularis]
MPQVDYVLLSSLADSSKSSLSSVECVLRRERGWLSTHRDTGTAQRAETAVSALSKDASTTKGDGSHPSPFKGKNFEAGRVQPFQTMQKLSAPRSLDFCGVGCMLQ